jgi:signal transduction histidine kinase
VGLLAVLLVLLFVAVDVALKARLDADLRTRLTDRVALAEQLSGSLDPDQLVQQLRGDNVLAEVCDGDSGYCASTRVAPAPPGSQSAPADRPGLGPAARGGPGEQEIRSDGDTLFLVADLDGGQRLTLQVDASTVSDTLSRLVVLEVVGGLAALALAWFALGRVVGVALRPLDDMTTLARGIAGGDRGRRLGSGRPDTELGRNAQAFDAMLDELESAVATAERAQEQMRAFLSDASHELRTPLAGLQASAENLLRADPGRLDRERALAAMVRESTRASRLVADLLTAARLAEGVQLELGEVDLGVLARHEVERQELLAPSVTWTAAVDGGAAAVVRADGVRVGQVLTNLLDNARRATPAGGTVEVRVRPEPGAVVLEVRDTGPGFPAADRERVFERFVRLDAARDRRSGGSGLGLAISRAIARAHGGDLVAVDPGAPTAGGGPGAVLRLTLPRTPA